MKTIRCLKWCNEKTKMLSILIPTFNYDVTALVTEVHKQSIACKIEFEILVYDDASTDLEVRKNNTSINALENASYTILKSNIGRSAIRNKLAKTAQYEWLLFLDADVMPSSFDFIENYINLKNSKYEAVFGGFIYSKKNENYSSNLRWAYGKKYEQVDAEKRNKTPYQITISANVLIKKPVFQSLELEETNRYGMDNYFGVKLRAKNCSIFHMQNPVLHCGLEDNETYLKKTNEGIDTLVYFFKKGKLKSSDNKLLALYLRLKAMKLHQTISILGSVLNPIIKINLLGSKPKTSFFQMYKLFYICKIMN